MYPEIDLFGSKLATFSLMMAIGIIAALFIYMYSCKKDKVKKEDFDRFCMLIPIILIGGFFGAMLFDKIAHWGEGGKKWYEPAGISFVGGLIAGALGFIIGHLLIIKKGFKQVFVDAERLIPSIVIAHCFGRVGCFFGGCCYGKPSNSIFAVTFPKGSLQHQQMGYITPVLPTQLFEAFFLLILFVLLFFFIKKYKVFIYLVSYAVFRFGLEYLRGDNRGKINTVFSPSQMTSFFLLLGALVLIIYQIKIDFYGKKKEELVDIQNISTD